MEQALESIAIDEKPPKSGVEEESDEVLFSNDTPNVREVSTGEDFGEQENEEVPLFSNEPAGSSLDQAPEGNMANDRVPGSLTSVQQEKRTPLFGNAPSSEGPPRKPAQSLFDDPLQSQFNTERKPEPVYECSGLPSEPSKGSLSSSGRNGHPPPPPVVQVTHLQPDDDVKQQPGALMQSLAPGEMIPSVLRESTIAGAPASGSAQQPGSTAPGPAIPALGRAAAVAGVASTAGTLQLRVLRDVHQFQPTSVKLPVMCAICSKPIVSLLHTGVRCSVCRMEVHAECRVALVTPDHKCRQPQALSVRESVPEVRMTAHELAVAHRRSRGNSQTTSGGGGGGGGGGGSGGPSAPAPGRNDDEVELEDPLASVWHQRLRARGEAWVPDSVAPACMVCGAAFGLFTRRHHCRRCGACVCAGCSASRVTDPALLTAAAPGCGTGGMAAAAAAAAVGAGLANPGGEAAPVRTCTKCTAIIDRGIRRQLKSQGWGQQQHQQAKQN